MTKVTRYSLTAHCNGQHDPDSSYSTELEEWKDDDGKWVYYEDIEHLLEPEVDPECPEHEMNLEPVGTLEDVRRRVAEYEQRVEAGQQEHNSLSRDRALLLGEVERQSALLSRADGLLVGYSQTLGFIDEATSISKGDAAEIGPLIDEIRGPHEYQEDASDPRGRGICRLCGRSRQAHPTSNR